MRFIEIGANLTDAMFRGFYHGKQVHPDDVASVLARAWQKGVHRLLVTVGCREDWPVVEELFQRFPLHPNAKYPALYGTIGCHPTRCQELEREPQVYIQEMMNFALKHKSRIVAVGECGLDYERLQFCDVATQKQGFQRHFELAQQLSLPMFLHLRGGDDVVHDFCTFIEQHRSLFKDGVVHSFDGTLSAAEKLLSLNLLIGLNGCSFRQMESLQVIRQIPLSRIMLETDAPWCDVRPTHAGFGLLSDDSKLSLSQPVKKEKWKPDQIIKGRNEPCHITLMAEMIAALHETEQKVVADQCYENTMQVFFPVILSLEKRLIELQDWLQTHSSATGLVSARFMQGECIKNDDRFDFSQHSLHILDASFNPPTLAHLALLEQAIKHRSSQDPVILALSRTNVDKSPLDAMTCAKRLLLMEQMLLFLDATVPFYIVLYDAPRYVDKLPIILEHWNVASVTFYIGQDVYDRLFSMKYYTNQEAFDVALQQMFHSSKVSWLVARRGQVQSSHAAPSSVAWCDLDNTLTETASTAVRQYVTQSNELDAENVPSQVQVTKAVWRAIVTLGLYAVTM